MQGGRIVFTTLFINFGASLEMLGKHFDFAFSSGFPEIHFRPFSVPLSTIGISLVVAPSQHAHRQIKGDEDR